MRLIGRGSIEGQAMNGILSRAHDLPIADAMALISGDIAVPSNNVGALEFFFHSSYNTQFDSFSLLCSLWESFSMVGTRPHWNMIQGSLKLSVSLQMTLPIYCFYCGPYIAPFFLSP